VRRIITGVHKIAGNNNRAARCAALVALVSTTRAHSSVERVLHRRRSGRPSAYTRPLSNEKTAGRLTGNIDNIKTRSSQQYPYYHTQVIDTPVQMPPPRRRLPSGLHFQPACTPRMRHLSSTTQTRLSNRHILVLLAVRAPDRCYLPSPTCGPNSAPLRPDHAVAFPWYNPRLPSGLLEH
jgi:hypothetical protein